MNGEINDALLRSLVREIDRFPPAVPGGHMKRQIDETDSYEESGLTFVADDFLVGLQYAGLAVLARDMHRYLSEHPRDDSKFFDQAVSAVNKEDSKHYGGGAFPNFEGLPADNLPEGLAAAADAGQLVIAPLGDRAIVHEWTFKPGKRLFVKFSSKFKDTICGKDGPYEQFKKGGLVGQAALPTTIATTVLTVGFSAATLWYPLAAYISVLLVKTGLKTYCES